MSHFHSLKIIRGPALVRFENIRNAGQTVEFGVVVSGMGKVIQPEVVQEIEPVIIPPLQEITEYEKTGDEIEMEQLRDENKYLRGLLTELRADLTKLAGLLANIDR